METAQELTASPLGQQRLAERKVRVEGIFGLAKELHGLRRTRFKGRRKVQLQLWLTAAAMNLKRAVQALRRGMPPAPTRRGPFSRDQVVRRRWVSLRTTWATAPYWTSTLA